MQDFVNCKELTHAHVWHASGTDEAYGGAMRLSGSSPKLGGRETQLPEVLGSLVCEGSASHRSSLVGFTPHVLEATRCGHARHS